MKQQAGHSHEDKLLDFAYGELPEAEARTVEAHVQGCAKCSGSLDSIRGVRRTMSLLETEEAPDAGLESLMAYAQQTARRIQAGPAPKKSKWRTWTFALAGVTSLVMVGVIATMVQKEVAAPSAIIAEKATTPGVASKDQGEMPAPAAAPMADAQLAEDGLAANSAGKELGAERKKVLQSPPSMKGRVVTEEGNLKRDGMEIDVDDLAKLASRETAKKGGLRGTGEGYDYNQSRGLGAAGTGRGAGVVGGSLGDTSAPGDAPAAGGAATAAADKAAEADRVAETRARERQGKGIYTEPEAVTNYVEGGRAQKKSPPPPPPAPAKPTATTATADAKEKAAPSKLSLGSKNDAVKQEAASDDEFASSAAAAPAEMEAQEEQPARKEPAPRAETTQQAPASPAPSQVVAAADPESRGPSGYSAGAAAPPKQQAAPSTRRADEAKVASLSATEYERLADEAKKKGNRADEIRYLLAAVERTSPGGQQIGYLSRLCDLEISVDKYQPQSCHRLVNDYPRHNAGLLARKRLQAQEQEQRRKKASEPANVQSY